MTTTSMIVDQVTWISNWLIFCWRIIYKGESKAHVNGSVEEEVVRNGEGGVGGEEKQHKKRPQCPTMPDGVFRLRWGIKEFYSAIWDALLGTEEIWAALFSNHMLVKKQTGT